MIEMKRDLFLKTSPESIKLFPIINVSQASNGHCYLFKQ
jgi:hypothetical protein